MRLNHGTVPVSVSKHDLRTLVHRIRDSIDDAASVILGEQRAQSDLGVIGVVTSFEAFHDADDGSDDLLGDTALDN